MTNILDDITSKDAQRIWSSASAIIKLRDLRELSLLAEHVEEIKQSTIGVEMGGMLRPNSVDLEFAIHKLELVKNGLRCLCDLYRLNDRFDPSEEAKAGNITILSQASDADTWTSAYECQCCACPARYHVEQGEYHYTWWAWTRV